MGDVFLYLDLRAQGRTKEQKYKKSWKAVLYMLEDAAAIPSQNQTYVCSLHSIGDDHPCEFSGEPRATFLMDFSPSKLRVASTHGDHTVRVSDVRTGKCTHILTGHPRTPWCLAFSPTSDDILASGCLAGEIHIWDLMGGGSEVLRNPCRGQVVTSLAFHPGGQVLAFASMNIIYFWDWSKDKPFASTQTSHESERIRWLKFDPYGHYLYTGIGNLTSFNRDIVGAEMEVSSDGLDEPVHTEDRRNQQQLNRARYQRLLERFMAFQQDRSRYRYEQVQPSLLRNSDTYEPSNNPHRARQRSHGPTAEVEVVSGQPLRHRHSASIQSSAPSPAVEDEAFAWGDNGRGQRNLDSGWSFRGRQGELQPRQRWGRYVPSFFTRSNDSSDSNSVISADDTNSSSNNYVFNNGSNNTYRSNISDNAASRIGINSRQRGQSLCPYPRTNLFPPSFEESPAAPSSFSYISSSRRSSTSENAASEGLDTDEFEILPVDQGRKNRYISTRNRSVPSVSSGCESSGHRSNFLQQRDELRALLNRYVNRPSDESSASSGASSMATIAPSQNFMSSAASTADYGETDVRSSSVPSLAAAAQTITLCAQQTGGTHLCTADSDNSTISSDVFFGAESQTSFEIQLQKAVPSTSEDVICTEEGTSMTNDISKYSASPSVHQEESSKISEIPEEFEPFLRRSTSPLRSYIREDYSPFSNQEAGSRRANTSRQTKSLLNHSDTTMKGDVSHNSPLAPHEAASSTPAIREVGESSFPMQQRATHNKADRPEQDNRFSGRHTFKWGNSHEDSTPFSGHTTPRRTAKLANKDFLSGSQEATDKTYMPEESSPVIPSTMYGSEQGSARLRCYDVASKRAARNAQSPHPGSHEGTAKGADSSMYTNSLRSFAEVRPRCTNPLLNNFEATSMGADKPECNMPHSRLDTTSRMSNHEQSNLLLRSVESTANRTRHQGTSTMTSTESENPSTQNFDAALRRTHRLRYRRPLLRQETASRTHGSLANRGIHAPFSLGQSQALRNTRVAFGGHSWGPYEGLEYRHHLSAFHDRQIPRPVTDQTSQTLGAMNLPASSDQGTDVAGLNDTPLNIIQVGNIIESPLGSLTPGNALNAADNQSCTFSSIAHNDTSDDIPRLYERNRVDGSLAQVNRSERFQRIQNIVRSVRAYISQEYGESFLDETVNYGSTEPRSQDVVTDLQGNTTSERTLHNRLRDRHLRNVHTESESDHANRSSTESMIDGERSESAEHVTGNSAAGPWDSDISLPFTVPSSTFIDTTISSTISAVRPAHGTSALYGAPAQVHRVPSIYASYPVLSSSASSASRVIHLLANADSDAPESDQFHDANTTSRSNTSFVPDLGYRSLLNSSGHEHSPRFHPYATAMHRGRNPFRPRLRASRDFMNNYPSVSDTTARESRMTSAASGDCDSSSSSFERSVLHDSVGNKPSSSANVTSRLRHSIDSDQPSAFSIFSTSNREIVTHPSQFRIAASHPSPSAPDTDSGSSPYQAHGAQSQSISQNLSPQSSSLTQTVMHDSGQDPTAGCESGNSLESFGVLSNSQQASARNVTRRTPDLSLVNQVAVTEYLERRVIELDRRLSDLEQSYNSRLRELQLECQWRRSVQDSLSCPTRLRGVNIGPLHDPRDSTLFQRAENSTQASSSEGGTQPAPFRQLLECLRRQDPNPQPRVSEADLPTSVTISQARDDAISEETQAVGSSQLRRRPWHSLRQIHLHSDYSRNILDDTVNRLDDSHRVLSSHMGGPFANLEYDIGLASNMVQTHRIQQWNIRKHPVPNITDASVNIIVRHCKLHNDASCTLAQDGTLLATIVPSYRGFSDSNIVALFSLRRQTFAQCLFTKSFGPNAISISISPLNRYILVGLASRRTIFVTSAQMVGQVFRLVKEKAGESSMKHHKDIYHIYDEDRGNHVSVNSARWLPVVGEGLVYGTNRGDLHFFRAGSRKVYDRGTDDDREESAASRRRTTARNSIATQTTTVSIRRSASTQTLSDEPVSEERMDIVDDHSSNGLES